MATFEQAQRVQLCWELLPPVALPVTEMAELLFGTGRTQPAGPAFIKYPFPKNFSTYTPTG